MLCTQATLDFYANTTGKFVSWLGIVNPDQIELSHIRSYLSELHQRGLKSSSIHCHARGIKTFIRFCYHEGYSSELINFKMPKVEKTKQPILNEYELNRVLRICKTPRDKVIILLSVDTGLRRSELLNLEWGDIDIPTGLVRVRRGKGRKDRSVVVGAQARRGLLKYRRTVSHRDRDSVVQTYNGRPLKTAGLRMALKRLGDKLGIRLTSHMLRRTFATLSLRAGINPLHLQALMGHASLETTKSYIQLVDEDLINAHNNYGPIDHFVSKRR